MIREACRWDQGSGWQCLRLHPNLKLFSSLNFGTCSRCTSLYFSSSLVLLSFFGNYLDIPGMLLHRAIISSRFQKWQRCLLGVCSHHPAKRQLFHFDIYEGWCVWQWFRLLLWPQRLTMTTELECWYWWYELSVTWEKFQEIGAASWWHYILYIIHIIYYILYRHIRKSLFLIIGNSTLLFEFIVHIYWNTILWYNINSICFDVIIAI